MKAIIIFALLIILHFNNVNNAQSVLVSDSSFTSTKPDTNKSKLPISMLHTAYKFKPFGGEDINKPILYAVSGVAIGIGVAVHLYNYNAWWKNDRSSKFRIINDWEYALWIDKIGHFYGTAIEAHGLSSALEAANVPPEETAIILL